MSILKINQYFTGFSTTNSRCLRACTTKITNTRLGFGNGFGQRFANRGHGEGDCGRGGPNIGSVQGCNTLRRSISAYAPWRSRCTRRRSQWVWSEWSCSGGSEGGVRAGWKKRHDMMWEEEMGLSCRLPDLHLSPHVSSPLVDIWLCWFLEAYCTSFFRANKFTQFCSAVQYQLGSWKKPISASLSAHPVYCQTVQIKPHFSPPPPDLMYLTPFIIPSGHFSRLSRCIDDALHHHYSARRTGIRAETEVRTAKKTIVARKFGKCCATNGFRGLDNVKGEASPALRRLISACICSKSACSLARDAEQG